MTWRTYSFREPNVVSQLDLMEPNSRENAA